MELEGPDSFRITIRPAGDPKRFDVEDAKGAVKFSGKAASRSPKLYVVSANKRPIYVGVTKQSMRQRLRLGWTATGESGYYGYAWRHHYSVVGLDIWHQVGTRAVDSMRDLETVEAEVVFLIRQDGQWPAFQTEIHFHESTPEHRTLAEAIWSYYRKS